jgi:hypothetical protein
MSGDEAEVSNSSSDGLTAVPDVVVVPLSGEVFGEVGVSYESATRRITVTSIQTLSEFEGRVAQEGFELVDVMVEESNLGTSPLEISADDFYLVEAGGKVVLPLEPFSPSMLSQTLVVEVGQMAVYHRVYEVEAETGGLSLVYSETDSTGGAPSTLTIAVS